MELIKDLASRNGPGRKDAGLGGWSWQHGDPWSLGRSSGPPGSLSTRASLPVSPTSTRSPVHFQTETEQDPAGLLGTKAFLCFSFLDDWKETASH